MRNAIRLYLYHSGREIGKNVARINLFSYLPNDVATLIVRLITPAGRFTYFMTTILLLLNMTDGELYGMTSTLGGLTYAA